MQKGWLKTAVSATTLAVMLASAGAQAATFKLGHVFDSRHPYHTAALDAAEQFHQCTAGEHNFDIYPASQLGSDAEMQEQILIGGLDATLAGFLFTANSYPPLAMAAAPFILNDREHALRYQDSEMYREAWRGWEEVTGGHVLASAFLGFFNVTSNTPIDTPEDMVGLKIRVPNIATYAAFPEAVGATPTPIALHEVYLALQQGVAEASVNGLSMTYASKLYEVQEYINLTGHMVDYTLFITSDSMWSRLDEAGRECLKTAANYWGKLSTDLVYELEKQLREDLEGEIIFNDVDREAFQAASGEAIQKFADMLGVDQETVDALRGL